MTVSSSTRKSGPYIGNGVNTAFPFNFKVFTKADVQPVFTNSDGNETDLVLDSDYSVVLNADQDQNPGGTVTYPIQIGATLLSASERLTLIGGMVVDQQTDITNAGRFLPQVQENAFDKLTILLQQLQEVAGRTLRAAVGTTVKLVFPAPSSGKFIRWNSTLTGLENVDAGTDSMALQGMLADSALPNRGAGMLGYKPKFLGGVGQLLVDKLSREFISVYDFGAKGDNIADDTAAIQAAFDYVRLTGRAGCVDFRTGGIFRINKPIKGTYNVKVRGSATILAVAPFGTVTFDIQGGGTLVAAPMFYFVDSPAVTPGNAGTIGNFSGSRRYGLDIDMSIVLNADDVAGFGIFLDNYFDYRIRSRIIDPTKWGVWHYSNGWGGEIHSYITGPGEGGVWLGGACNGINLDHLKVWGDNKVPTIAGLLIDGDNNGISTKGTFIEKVRKGLICRDGCGPMDFSGIDFEKIDEETVLVDNTAVPSRIGGPVTIQGCFLETSSPTHALVRATNAIVITRGNRMRNAAKAFEHTGNGHILDESNMMQSTVLSVGTGRVISKGVKSTRNWAETSYSGASQTLEVVREFSNHAYAYNPALPSSGIQFWHAITDVGTQRMVGRVDVFVNDMQGGVEIGRTGLRANNTGGGAAKHLTPLEDNATSAGSATNRYSVVFAGSGSISTSDEREKQDIESIPDAVLDAWAEVEFKQYRWQHAFADKGDQARIHFGFIAQQIKTTFETHGIDGTRFGLLCHDAWGDEYEVDRNADGTAKLKVDENSNPIPKLDGEGQPTGEFEVEMTLVRSAGDRWGVRIDECMLLETALMRRELARMAARVAALESGT